MSLPLHTGFDFALCRYRSIRALISPYVAAAPYGLFFALCRCRSIRAIFRPMSLPLHTGFWLRLLPGGQYAFAAALLPRGQYAQLLQL